MPASQAAASAMPAAAPPVGGREAKNFFSWFRSLGRKQRGQWVDVSDVSIHIGRRQKCRHWLSVVTCTTEEALRSPDTPIVRSRSFTSRGAPDTSSPSAPSAGKHRRNQSDGTHVAKVWKQASQSEPVSVRSFNLEKVLGKGGFGKVLLVTKKDTQQLYALKVLKKDHLIQSGQVEAVKTEHQLLHSMNHPFLTSLHFAWQTEDKLYLCMTYCPGGELFYIRQQQGVFTPARVQLYVAEIALAIGALHSSGFIYRDLKLENLLLDAQGHIMLTDFGLTQEAERCTTFCGTPEYVAPEMIEGKSYGKGVDWWALGTLTYEMSTGASPFFSHNQNVMFHKILRQPLVLPDCVTPAAQSLITGLMQKRPEARLGAGEGDVAELQQHSFFQGLDWDRVLEKGYTPDFLPLSKSSSDMHAAKHFDPTFTSMPACDSISLKSSSESFSHSQTSHFANFTYPRPESHLVGSPAA